MKNKFKMSAFDSSDELAGALSQKLGSILDSAIKNRGAASVAVSGGSTPKKLFEKLSKIDLDWSKVTVTLVDERWVDTDSSASNERLVKEFLLQNRAKDAKFIGLKNALSVSPEALMIVKAKLRNIDKLDIVVLGMGGDAHTASFFPNAKSSKSL